MLTTITKDIIFNLTDFVCESKANKKSHCSKTINKAMNKITIAIGEK